MAEGRHEKSRKEMEKNKGDARNGRGGDKDSADILQHCKKRHLRSVPFLKQFSLFTENSGKELNVKDSSLKSSEEVFP
jgi:hypothetical protein